MKKLAQFIRKGMNKGVSMGGGWGNITGRTGDIQVTEKGGTRREEGVGRWLTTRV